MQLFCMVDLFTILRYLLKGWKPQYAYHPTQDRNLAWFFKCLYRSPMLFIMHGMNMFECFWSISSFCSQFPPFTPLNIRPSHTSWRQFVHLFWKGKHGGFSNCVTLTSLSWSSATWAAHLARCPYRRSHSHFGREMTFSKELRRNCAENLKTRETDSNSVCIPIQVNCSCW